MTPSSASILREVSTGSCHLAHPYMWSVDLMHVWPHFSDCGFYVGCWSEGVCSWGSKSGVSVSQSPPALLELKLWIFKACYGSSSSQCRTPGWGVPDVGLGPLASQGGLPCLSVAGQGCVGPYQTTSPSLLSLFMWLFLYIFSCGRAALLVFRSSPETIALM